MSVVIDEVAEQLGFCVIEFYVYVFVKGVACIDERVNRVVHGILIKVGPEELRC